MDTVVIILLILLLLAIAIILLLVPPPKMTSPDDVPVDSPIITLGLHEFSIVPDNVTKSLEQYCQSWGYSLNSMKSDYILYLNEELDDNVELAADISLDSILDIAGTSEYVVFSDSKSFISRNKNITNRTQLDDILKTDIVIEEEALNTILDMGFPYRGIRGTILHRNYLDRIIKSEILLFESNMVMPNLIPRKYEGKPTKIPKIIHQSFETRMLPNCLSAAAYTWINRNPDYEYRYYDNGDRRELIRNNFDSKVLAAYDSLIPGAYRCDLWRVCAVYVYGGIYIDIKNAGLVALDKIVDADIDLLLVNDINENTMYNALFGAKAKDPIIYAIIQEIVKRVLAKEYGPHNLYPTGPMAMGHIILPVLGFTGHAPVGKYAIDNVGIIQVYEHLDLQGGGRIISNGEIPLIKTRHNPMTMNGPYFQKLTGHPNYGVMWKKRQIYREF